MRERGTLFQAPMVRALLRQVDPKTQTRRLIKPQPDVSAAGNLSGEWLAKPMSGLLLPKLQDIVEHCPYGVPGDRLWVREAWRAAASLDKLSPKQIGEKSLDAGYSTPWCPIQFEADGARTGGWHGFDTPPKVTEPGRLRASMHLPRWASRITLEITGVRVERLQDISAADAIAEGIRRVGDGFERFHVDPDAPQGQPFTRNPVLAYRGLWESINGADSWDANPYVWVVAFRRVAAC